ncbi:phosphatidylinositol N-acetylglucosaminyltransferase subunit Q isoform X2 [Nilaparvata lugens]|uniref:phosphatidylinositol N-acetylglucosaminyltransferase subunit Q isoform X1 n=1 Tax=Nilaparvata lugens TaxID=108931 RepID=UPI00193EAF86|nr:phosphatidylinositol N-acetylglucosaminyltransferase subunit Q isoform X1 [Nilaparvata lugens]XP_039290803.1 phosphatidylinositol N-acetylglucosaminyltransferase subunit Q isoform X2 [Nilaparvata lugens]
MSIIIFSPSIIFDEDSGLLLGSVHSYLDDKCEIKVIVIYDKIPYYSVVEKCGFDNEVGYFYCSEVGGFSFSEKFNKKQNWLSLNVLEKEKKIKLEEIKIDGLIVNPDQCRFVIYDKSLLLESELLSKRLQSMSFHQIVNNYFLLLVFLLRKANPPIKKPRMSPNVLNPILLLVQNILSYITMCMPILKISTLGLHFQKSLSNFVWFLLSTFSEERFNLKVGNYFFSVIFDILLGTIVLDFLQEYFTMTEFFEHISNLSQDLVVSLKNLIEWLMGSPAGLKLNFPLNSVLGKFFLYHIDLWWFFLGLVRPFLEFGFYLLLLIGRLGVTFQIAILADLLALASFHVYCIYVYAARLYNLQLNGLVSLSRLFIGCKRNPLPGKVDSCPYTTEQLFVGTIAFTVLLFLLPTTLVYYVVFAALRLFVIMIGGILTRGRFLLQSLPIYVLLLRLLNPRRLTSSFEIIPDFRFGTIRLYLNPTISPLWEVIQECIPDPIERPAHVEWRKLARSLVMGNLIYPM